MVTTGRLRCSVAHLQALALAASAHGIERLLLRVMLSSIRSEFDDCCLTQQPFYLHASNDTVQPEAVTRRSVLQRKKPFEPAGRSTAVGPQPAAGSSAPY